jgi:hypothetical protein
MFWVVFSFKRFVLINQFIIFFFLKSISVIKLYKLNNSITLYYEIDALQNNLSSYVCKNIRFFVVLVLKLYRIMIKHFHVPYSSKGKLG